MHPGHPLALQGLKNTQRALEHSTHSYDAATSVQWQYAAEEMACAHTAIQRAAADMPALVGAFIDGSSTDPFAAVQAAGRQFQEFCQLPEVVAMMQQHPLGAQQMQDASRLSQCVLLLHAYMVAVEACLQHKQAYSSEDVAAVAMAAKWTQQHKMRSNIESSSRCSSSEGARTVLYETIWQTSVTLLSLLLDMQPGSTWCSTDAQINAAAHALDSSGETEGGARSAEHADRHAITARLAMAATLHSDTRFSCTSTCYGVGRVRQAAVAIA